MAKRRPNGDGMVRKIGRIIVGHKTDGSPIFRYVYGKTQKELTEKMHQKLNEYYGVELTEDSNMTLGEWLNLWLEKYMRNTIRESTFRSYVHIVKDNINPILGDNRRLRHNQRYTENVCQAQKGGQKELPPEAR